MTKAAIYARISTNDEKQNLANQLEACREFVLREAVTRPGGKPWHIVAEYVDRDSGAKEKRPGLQQMLADAARGRFEAVIVFSLSRLTRGGPARAFAYIDRLADHAISFYSVSEPLFTTAGHAGPLFIAIAAHIAQEERRQIQERIKAGFDRARREGRHIGRRRLAIDPKKLIHALHSGGSLSQIAKELNVSKSTAKRLLGRQSEAEK